MGPSFDALFDVRRFHYFILYLCNYCNLHCEHCSSLCNIPLDPISRYRSRRKKYEITIKDVELFCRRFDGLGMRNFIRLTGGETTAISPRKLGKIIDVLYSYDRRMWLMTNGYGLKKLNRRSLNHLERITLDNHGINEEHIWRLAKYLIQVYEGRFNVLSVKYHYNLRKARLHPDNKGKGCSLWMLTPEIYDRIIYPCCNLDFVEMYNNNNLMRNALEGAGWTLDNRKIIETMRNWRETIPPYVIEQCHNYCWHPNIRLGEKTRITLKADDDVFMV